ncbi:hypothetical protein BJ875DRAFT_459366 [Amylocarpus encephaloides]|uniref:Uncharacterized protein n=1 Tax=Amylocarpus encephaloides TaxID=45428 RepID=A0A9P7YLC3_9HELO|nr:hypothetical protein BJ875DRAFT_459366 [Amylocarpus encephaloides]
MLPCIFLGCLSLVVLLWLSTFERRWLHPMFRLTCHSKNQYMLSRMLPMFVSFLSPWRSHRCLAVGVLRTNGCPGLGAGTSAHFSL